MYYIYVYIYRYVNWKYIIAIKLQDMRTRLTTKENEIKYVTYFNAEVI